jgi:hypothetical protein
MSSLMCGPLGSEVTSNRDGESIFINQSHTQHQENRGGQTPRSPKSGVPMGCYVGPFEHLVHKHLVHHTLPGILLGGIAALAGIAAAGKGVALSAERWRSSPEGSDPSRPVPCLG